MVVAPGSSRGVDLDGGYLPLRVAFVHPDLGLGGAERLVVDAAQELATGSHKCKVQIYTSHHNENRCFEETMALKPNGLQRDFDVKVVGSWFPRQVGGRLVALCAIVRTLLCAAWVAWCTPFFTAEAPHVVFVDQVSAAVLPFVVANAFLPRDRRTRVVFYCHYPDLLLSSRELPGKGEGDGLVRALVHRLKLLYRIPLDWLEERTTGMADEVLVNSEYTKGVFYATFASLARRGTRATVVYPAVRIPPLGDGEDGEDGGRRTFLSINRYERKKDVALAIRALAEVKSSSSSRRGRAGRPRLVVAGGYDERLEENVEYHAYLVGLARELGLERDVTFVKSFTDGERAEMLSGCCAVLYTPQNEHFGIVPLEAMAAGRPVVACNSGGPLETVVDGETGFTCDPTPRAFSEAMMRIGAMGAGELRAMGERARRHVSSKFSRRAFGDRLHEIALGG
mmetsp:Transcript_3961/g.13925  ORF Transcript_3961/g.13925 Transcript_3961/m.13925 type:complete len:453 (+) Transcript_3961:129-1487(+)